MLLETYVVIRLHTPLVALLLFFLGYLWFAREIPLDLWASAGGFRLDPSLTLPAVLGLLQLALNSLIDS